MARRFRRRSQSDRQPGSASPVVEILVVLAAVYVLQTGLWLINQGGILALGPAIGARPWALVTSVYAHAGPTHLVSNVVAFVVIAPFVARRTTRLRFHAFFLVTGVLSGLAELAVGVTFGEPTLILGASGAILGLAGYLLAGNFLTDRLLARVSLPPKAQVALFGLLVVGVTLLTGGSRVALVAHATGFGLGLLAGRIGLLDASSGRRGRANP
jgi:membrane associated rhomboid family serine protease